MYNTLNEDIYN